MVGVDVFGDGQTLSRVGVGGRVAESTGTRGHTEVAVAEAGTVLEGLVLVGCHVGEVDSVVDMVGRQLGRVLSMGG